MDLSYLAAAVLAANLLVFLGGCILAVYRLHGEHARQMPPPQAVASRAVPFRLVSRPEAATHRAGK